MKFILLFLIISNTAICQIKIKAGIVTPIPFYIQTNYTVDVSSALVTISHSLKKWDFKASAGYLRFRPNTPNFKLAQNIPLILGGSYNISPSFYIGMQFGPSHFTETKENYKIKWLYSPHIGWHEKRWSVDLNYLNWEEIPDELNSLVLVIYYQIK